MTESPEERLSEEAPNNSASMSLGRRIERQRALLEREMAALSQRRAAIRKAIQRKAAAQRREVARAERRAAELLGKKLLGELVASDPSAMLMLDAWRVHLDPDERLCIERALSALKANKSGVQ